MCDYVKPLGDLQSFENEWMEVEVLGPRSPLLPAESSAGAIDISGAGGAGGEEGVPWFLCDHIDPDYMQLGSDSDSKHAHTLESTTGNRTRNIRLKYGSDGIQWNQKR